MKDNKYTVTIQKHDKWLRRGLYRLWWTVWVGDNAIDNGGSFTKRGALRAAKKAAKKPVYYDDKIVYRTTL